MRAIFLTALAPVLAISSCFYAGGPNGCATPIQVPECRCDAALAISICDSAGCAGELPDGERPKQGGAASIRIASEPGTLLSLIDSSPVARQIADHDILEALVHKAPDREGVEPELAESWKEGEDRASFAFRLAAEARWHDGRPVTSSDVRYTFDRVLDPSFESPLKSLFLDVAEVEEVDDREVVIRLDRPRSDFLVSLSELQIVPEHVFGRASLDKHPAARAPIGSGPFRFSRWLPGRLIEIERNPDWRGEPVLLDRVVYTVAPDARIGLDLFRRGDLDILTDPPESIQRIGVDARLIEFKAPSVEAWVFNTRSRIFGHKATRLAIAALVDRQAIRCSILGCRDEPVESLADGERPGSLPSPPRFDPSRARKILEAEGWLDEDGDGVRERNGINLSFTLLLPDSLRNLAREAVLVQRDLAGAGIEMRIAKVSWSVYSSRLAEGLFDAAVTSVPTLPAFDPWSLFHTRAIGGGRNLGAFGDPEIDGLLDKLQGEAGKDERRATEERLKARLIEEQPVVFTFRPHHTALVRGDLRRVRIRDGWFDERLMWRDGQAARGKNE